VNLTPEQKEQGRRNFLRAIAEGPGLAAVKEATAVAAAPKFKPVRVGFLGTGNQGRALLSRHDPAYAEVRALCDINPGQLAQADETLKKVGCPPARHYAEWKDMLEKEDIEAVVMAPPLWMHAELASSVLAAGKHVLCEKMMAWDEAGCDRMAAAAKTAGRVLEIGYQRYYNPTYVAAYHGLIQPKALGDVFHVRLVWHRNGNWRRNGQPPSPDYDPTRWGYPDFEHLFNWRLYWKYSKGLFAELASHQVNVVNWYLGAQPERVIAAGGVERYKDGREVQDHVYATWEYPGGPTAQFSSIESNASDGTYEAFFGTKATLVLSERDALLFPEAAGADSEASLAAAAPPAARRATGDPVEESTARALAWGGDGDAEAGRRITSSMLEISTFCAAVRGAAKLVCGPEKAMTSARACIRANEAAQKRTPLAV
jgi:predicted dehydrogenase